MTSPSPPHDNRRDHYRITDRAYLAYQRLGAPASGVAGGEAHAALAGCPDFAILHDAMTELYQQERDLSRVLATVNEREQPLTAAIRILNRKLEVVARLTLLQRIGLDDSKPLEINLSAGGIAFVTEVALPTDQELRLQLLLVPDLLPLLATARVIDSDPCIGGFWSRCAFLDLPEEQQDRLARHILKAQQSSRRSLR